jgi:uncharacterized protein (DUF58 family)
VTRRLRVDLVLLWFVLATVSGMRHRFVRRLTPMGLGLGGALVTAAVLGLDTNRTVAYQVFTFLLALALIAIAAVWRFDPDVAVRRLVPPYASAGEPLVYRVELRNEGRRALTGLRLLEDQPDPRPTLAEFLAADRTPDGRPVRPLARWRALVGQRRGPVIRECAVPAIGPGAEVAVRMQTTPGRRGRLVWTGATIARPDPFGVVKAFSRVPAPSSVIVLPRRHRVAGVALPGSRQYQPGGMAFASSVGDSEEFIGLRDYRPGDPLRRIHWRSWARTGKPIVREHQEEFFVRHALVLDTFAPFSDERFEDAVSVAASFACTVEIHESLLDLLFVGAEAYCFTAGHGVAHVGRLLEVLAGVDVCRDRSFADLQKLVVERQGLVSGAICVLLSWDDERREFVDALGRLGIPALVAVVTAPGAVLTPAPRHPGTRLYALERGRIAEGLARL